MMKFEREMAAAFEGAATDRNPGSRVARPLGSHGRKRRQAVAAALLFGVALIAYADKPRKPTPPGDAASYPLHETETAAKITVAAEPCDTPETEPNTRLDYFHHGYLPIRIIVTNSSDQPLQLDQARILFVTADSVVINAATEDELQRRLFTTKAVQPTKIPLGPLPSITIHHKPVEPKIVADMDDFGFQSTVVAPHSTAAGYLFYNTRDIDDPVLEKATLELRRIRFDSSGKELQSFEIPLKPTEAHAGAKPAAGTAGSH